MSQWDLTAAERQSLQAFLERLIETPSLSGQEGSVADLVIAEMRDLGYDEIRTDRYGNVLGRIGPADGPQLMFNSHMDTVDISEPDAWETPPYTPTVREGRLYGLGAADMKSGLAATVHGAALLARRQRALNGSVLVACVGLEECSEGTSTRALFEHEAVHPEWVVIAEPSNLQVVRAQRGHLEMTLTVHGKSAHASMPALGDNATYTAARLIFGLEILANQLADDAFLGPGVLAVTEICSQAASHNAIPHRCDLFIDRRLTVGETEALALMEIQRVIAREGVKADVHVVEHDVETHTGERLHARRASLPWVIDERHPLVQAMVQAVRSIGLRPTLAAWPFATEGAYTAAVARVPTVGFGPGSPDVVHCPNESVALNQLYTAARAYAALADRLVGA